MDTKQVLSEVYIKYLNGEDTGMSDEAFDTMVALFGYERYVTEIRNPLTQGDYIHPDFMVDILRRGVPRTKKNQDEKTELREDEVETFKYDGCSLIAYYMNGLFFDCATRGNDSTGKKQTEKLRYLFPRTMPLNVRAIQAEAVVAYEDFGDSCRGKANGLINSKYKQEEVEEYLRIIPWNVVTTEPLGYLDRMDLLPDSMKSLNPVKIKGKEFIETMYGTFPIDGIVTWSGNQTHPSRIVKFHMTEVVRTEVTNLEWNKSPKGVYIPKLVIKPVYISGTTIRRCSAKSLDLLISMGMGIGAKVQVGKSGGIIPIVVSVDQRSDLFNFPKCDKCGKTMTKFSQGVRCNNPDCSMESEEILRRFLDYTSTVLGEITENAVINPFNMREAISQQRLSEAHIEDMITDLGMPKSLEDLYTWTDDAQWILPEGMRGEWLRITEVYYSIFKSREYLTKEQ